MKSIAQVVVVLLLATMVATVFAQETGRPGGTTSSGGRTGWARRDRTVDFQRAVLLQATEEQKVAYRDCVATSDKARKLTDNILGPDTRWQFYPDLRSEQLKDVEGAVQDMFQGHQHFVQELSRAQEKALEKQLQRIEKLRSAIDQRIHRVVAEVQSSRPDRIAVHKDLRGIKESLDKWRSEHRAIGKEIGVARDATSPQPQG